MQEGLARLRAIDPATQRDPWRLQLDLAELLLGLGEVDQSAAAAARSLAARDTAGVHMVLARIALQRGDTATAARETRMAEAIDPKHPALPSLLDQVNRP